MGKRKTIFQSAPCWRGVNRTVWWGEINDQQETGSHWDNKINALWVSMTTGAPAVPLVQLVVEWPTCAKSLPASPLYFTVPRTTADETRSKLACALKNVAFLMEAAIFLLRRYL